MKSIRKAPQPLILILVLLGVSIMSYPQIHEEVNVTAYEVPIRVLLNGETVKGLTKEDFEIYERNERQEITGFDVISRKIIDPSVQGQKKKPKKRVFILIFNIFDYFDAVGDSIDDFFNHYFQPGDTFIIITENQLFEFDPEGTIPEIKNSLKHMLEEYKKKNSRNILNAYEELATYADSLYAALTGSFFSQVQGDIAAAIVTFYDQYLRIWKNYRRMYLWPDTDFYKNLIEHIKLIEGEKWVICFMQRDLFPKLKIEGPLENQISTIKSSLMDGQASRVRMIETKQMELQKSFAIASHFPSEALENIFLEANLTFHLILMESFKQIDSQHFELQSIDMELERCFKDLSFLTGGYATFSRKLTEALEKAAEKEDYHYVLWFSPKNLSLKEKDIKVKVNVDGARVIFRKHFAEQLNPPVSVRNFRAEDKSIRFIIHNYEMIQVGEDRKGYTEVTITLYDQNSKIVFDSSRVLEFVNKRSDLAISFNSLISGEYFIIIEVIDKISNEKHVFSKPIIL